MVITIAHMANEPGTEFVASMKMPMKLYPVALPSLPPRSESVQNIITIIIPKPRQPLIPTLIIRALGITVEAFATSSDIYLEVY